MVTLKNGYVLVNGLGDFPGWFVERASQAKVKMNFTYWVGRKQKTQVSYGVCMYALGPAGVAYRRGEATSSSANPVTRL